MKNPTIKYRDWNLRRAKWYLVRMLSQTGNRIMVAMSGGVDSSVAALLLVREGNEALLFYRYCPARAQVLR
jgi:tRNA(Ile)-lysidine synthase TilS/MesJ